MVKILNAYLGDGSTRVQKIYRGQDLIYSNTVEPELYITMPYRSDGIYAFIPVTTLGELEYNYKFEIDWTSMNIPANGPNALIGGSYDVRTDNNRFYGIIIGTKNFSSTEGRHGEIFQFDTWLRNTADLYYESSSTRHITTFQYTGEAQSPTTRTSGGFGLFAFRDYRDGSFVNINERARPLAYEDYRVFRISIYDTSDNLLMNFLPKEQGGHKGMIDTVSGTFFPCTDDSKFEIGEVE